jgi:hypothetical protein
MFLLWLYCTLYSQQSIDAYHPAKVNLYQAKNVNIFNIPFLKMMIVIVYVGHEDASYHAVE